MRIRKYDAKLRELRKVKTFLGVSGDAGDEGFEEALREAYKGREEHWEDLVDRIDNEARVERAPTKKAKRKWTPSSSTRAATTHTTRP